MNAGHWAAQGYANKNRRNFVFDFCFAKQISSKIETKSALIVVASTLIKQQVCVAPALSNILRLSRNPECVAAGRR
jgi:hypothetical protein